MVEILPVEFEFFKVVDLFVKFNHVLNLNGDDSGRMIDNVLSENTCLPYKGRQPFSHNIVVSELVLLVFVQLIILELNSLFAFN
jgi:hypothetical protein